MDIRTFAERILFTDDLSEKLTSPGRLLDADVGQEMGVIRLPGRPPGLQLSSGTKARIAFPRVAELDHDIARGRVLHFFANHELLALELMALALLRFPHAPAAFRRRLVATMRDEQKHLKLYLARMEVLGVELGEVPLNSFFWDRLSTVETPLEFVAGMSMTFEQANLDFSLFYRDAFKSVGDLCTADIMDEVLIDEIAHVRHGTHFFDQWRSPDLTQWDAYRALLQYPLTPSRAKGIGFTRSHRRKAGLDEDFIDHLEVFSHSKGRPPNVFIFNPEFELNLAEGYAGYTAPRHILGLKKDLETVPMFLARRDDVVLVSEPVRPHFLADLKARGYTTPEFVVYNGAGSQIEPTNPLIGRLLEGCEPWGWDHGVAQFLQPLASRFREGPDVLSDRVVKRVRLASKSWLATHAESILDELPDELRTHCITDTLPQVISDGAALEKVLTTYQELGYKQAVVKAPFGSAGRSAVRVDLVNTDARALRWIQKIVVHQGTVVVEPWYERLLDLSYLFRLNPDGQMEGIGQTRFLTDENGRYRGTFLAPLKRVIPPMLKSFFYQAGGHPNWIWEVVEHAVKRLIPALHECQFTGLAGIDFMVVRHQDQAIKLRVPLELNPRPTMGHVARMLAHPLGSRAVGVWLLLTRKEITDRGHTSFEGFLRILQGQLPDKKNEDGRFLQGVFPTNDPHRAQHVCGICLTAPRLESIARILSDLNINLDVWSGD